jgi:hypothetical protein
MIAMAHKIEGGEYLTIAEAVAYIGCTDSWVRHLIREGKLIVRTFSERLKLVPLAEAERARDGLSTRANGKKHLAKRPAAKRKKPKKAVARRK